MPPDKSLVADSRNLTVPGALPGDRRPSARTWVNDSATGPTRHFALTSGVAIDYVRSIN